MITRKKNGINVHLILVKGNKNGCCKKTEKEKIE
jgi:hypothetical protein